MAPASKGHRIGEVSFSLMDDRQLGQKLVAALPDGTKPEPDQMLSALHDLLPAGDPILEPLKLMVQRPEFLALAMPSQANRQTNAQDQEEALLESFIKIYRPEIMARLMDVLAGVREKWASRSPMDIEPIDGKSLELSDLISQSKKVDEYLNGLDSDPVSFSASSTALSDQTGQTSDSIPPQTSPESLPNRPQKMLQNLVVDNPITIETLDKTIIFYGLWAHDLFKKKNNSIYYIYITFWPFLVLPRFFWGLITYFNRTKKALHRLQDNIEKNMARINDTLSKQQE